MTQKTGRPIKTLVAALGISAVLLAAIEGIVRLVQPQVVRSTMMAGSSLGVPDSVLGHLYRPGAIQLSAGPEFSVQYVISTEGFRDRDIHHPLAGGDTVRILLLGDSFAMGAGVAYQDIWPVVMERRLLERGYPVDVVKAGVSGYDTTREVLYLERIFAQYRPHIVIITFLPNDLFTNTPTDAQEATGSVDGVIGSKYDRRLHTVLLLQRLLLHNNGFYRRTYMATVRGDFFREPPTELVQTQISLTRRLFEKAQRFVQAGGGCLMVVSVPQQFQVMALADEWNAEHLSVRAPDKLLADHVGELGVEWVASLDTLVSVSTEGEDLFFRVDGHLNAEGNAVLGKFVADRLTAFQPWDRFRGLGHSSAADSCWIA